MTAAVSKGRKAVIIGVVSALGSAGCGSASKPPPAPARPTTALPAAAAATRARTTATATATAASQNPPTHPSLIDADAAFDATWERGEARDLGLDEAVLAGIVTEAEATRSDALLVIRDGKVVVERYFGKPKGPIETMSVTKSIVSIAIGMLVADGKIRSVDDPLSTWFPEWKSGKKASVTLRHVLTQTSGLDHKSGAKILNQQPDRLKYVRKAAIVDEPGARFSYNNEATQLLSGVVAAAAGKPLDAFLSARLFAPLEIRDFRWDKDQAGNVQTYYGLALTARDLAKIGLLMLAGGSWHGAKLVPAEWVTASTTEQVPQSGYGYLWWVRRGQGSFVTTSERLQALEQRGFAAASKLNPLLDRALPANGESYWMEVGAFLDAGERSALAALVESGALPYVEHRGEPIGFAGDGWLGQQLIVLPSRGIVAVRQHREPTKEMADDAYNRRYGFFSLVHRLERAAPLGASASSSAR